MRLKFWFLAYFQTARYDKKKLTGIYKLLLMNPQENQACCDYMDQFPL